MNRSWDTPVSLKQRQLHAVYEALIVEFADKVAAGTVIRTVALCARELRLAGVGAGLPDAVKAMARQRLYWKFDDVGALADASDGARSGTTQAESAGA
jgi:hypothetical protein